ncbi:HAD family hydrolase [Streptomyces sp. NPDC046909]|uniref:HAD family hydrolase n=1 Tax=Streptomyces sp. NPDC046909 TaxID=3155617 RepID=UPI0033FE4542
MTAPTETGAGSWTPRFIATDLDGTIVDRDGHVTDAVLDTLREAAGRGWVIVLATGRSWARTAKVLDDHPELSWQWVVCGNGAEVRAAGEPEPVLLRTVGIEAPVTALRDRLPDLVLVAEHASGTYLTTALLPEGELDGPQKVVDWAELADLDCTRWILSSLTGSPELFEAELGRTDAYDRLVYQLRGRTWADLQAAGVTKAGTLELLRRRLGIDPGDTLCVGDSWNDIGMITWAAVGAATTDAPDEVTSVADLLIPPCAEDGVARLLRRYLDPAALPAR